ncbi:hypothetical protein KIN20_035019 [Parelaphostrongylus tenuis]|uniref:Mos1 transposase HTH domain-containing protein n=1 Tax=Parelaphostrongylus tenuis TaxID=148309 RepID=A0AAD5WK46_PARTN|nr:hypothetical protein KIN20_035019 [Parelaphostrongylus tenuis]
MFCLEAVEEIHKSEGRGTATKSTVGRWFKRLRFEEASFDLEDMPRSGLPSVSDESDLQAPLDAEPSQLHL